MDLKESLPSVPFRSLLIHSVCSRDAALFIEYYGQQPFFLDGRTRNSKFAIDLDFQNEVPQSKKDFTLGRKLNLFRILEYARAVIPRGWLMAYAHAYIIGRRSPWIASMPSERSTLTGVRINSGKLFSLKVRSCHCHIFRESSHDWSGKIGLVCLSLIRAGTGETRWLARAHRFCWGAALHVSPGPCSFDNGPMRP
jgi:hypothetical protein